MARTTIASLRAEIAALRAEIAAQPAARTSVRTFATKAEREAGNGFPCTAPEPCSRTDLRTPGRAAIHGIDEGGHTPK